MKPIEIIGGGVAGLSLGIALRTRGVPVTLREAATYPRHRLCGEFINGVSQATLDKLGVAPFLHDAGQEQRTRWWREDRLLLERHLVRPARTLSRWRMDARLADGFKQLGGDLRVAERAEPSGGEGCVRATGRRHHRGSDWMGLKAHFTGVGGVDGLEMHLGEGGYVGLAAVEDGRVNVCGLFHRRQGLAGKGAGKLLAYLEACGLTNLVNRLQAADADERSLTGVSGVVFGKQTGGGFSIGDAERIIPPFTGNGMSMAFEAAECALDPLVAWAGGDLAWPEAEALASRAMEKRFSARMHWARALQGLLMKKAGRQLLDGLAAPGLIPFAYLNRRLT